MYLDKPEGNLLIVGTPQQDSDLYYACRFMAPDPVAYARVDGKSYLLLSALEVDRGRKNARVDNVVNMTGIMENHKNGGEMPSYERTVQLFLDGLGKKGFAVPATFPLMLADKLRSQGYTLNPLETPFFPGRAIKTDEEVELIRAAVKTVERAMHHAIDTLQQTDIDDDGQLLFKGKLLTADIMRAVVDVFLLENGYLAHDTIVACGDEGVDPHNIGHGPLMANQPIIFDIFPRSTETHYWGDFTRTVVVGKASDELKKQYRAVADAQDAAIDIIAAGVNGRDVHNKCVAIFTERGFKTGEIGGRMQGFFHGTGHGLGLDIHEYPRVSTADIELQAGNVVTVEPGLYYLGAGGVRLEDVVVVRDGGCENLTDFERVLEIS